MLLGLICSNLKEIPSTSPPRCHFEALSFASRVNAAEAGSPFHVFQTITVKASSNWIHLGHIWMYSSCCSGPVSQTILYVLHICSLVYDLFLEPSGPLRCSLKSRTDSEAAGLISVYPNLKVRAKIWEHSQKKKKNIKMWIFICDCSIRSLVFESFCFLCTQLARSTLVWPPLLIET